jgi:hypothetical protein
MILSHRRFRLSPAKVHGGRPSRGLGQPDLDRKALLWMSVCLGAVHGAPALILGNMFETAIQQLHETLFIVLDSAAYFE